MLAPLVKKKQMRLFMH